MLQASATVSFIVKCYFLKFFFFKKNLRNNTHWYYSWNWKVINNNKM